MPKSRALRTTQPLTVDAAVARVHQRLKTTASNSAAEQKFLSALEAWLVERNRLLRLPRNGGSAALKKHNAKKPKRARGQHRYDLPRVSATRAVLIKGLIDYALGAMLAGKNQWAIFESYIAAKLMDQLGSKPSNGKSKSSVTEATLMAKYDPSKRQQFSPPIHVHPAKKPKKRARTPQAATSTEPAATLAEPADVTTN